MSSSFDWKKLKQLSVTQILLAFFLPSGFAFFGFRFVLPKMVELGYPKVLMWGVIASIMLLIFVIIGFLLIRKEAQAIDISVGERLLLKKIGIRQWLICIGIMLVGVVLSIVLSPFLKRYPDCQFLIICPFG